VKTNRATGFALVLTFTCFGGLAFMPACSGNQADVSYGQDGAILMDAQVGPAVDSGTGVVDTGTAAKPDAPGSTFIDSGTGTTPDTGVVVTPDATTSTGDGGSGTCPPASCTADSDCSCLTASGSIGCCDTVTTACFQSASSTCPDQTSSGGGDAGGGGYP
jgi:hypothetical protein